MRKSIKTIMLIAAVLIAPAAALSQHHHQPAQEPETAAVTLEGEIVCMHCYNESGLRGPEHADCAAECAKKGYALGLLTDDGTVYPLMPAPVETQLTKAAGFAMGHLMMCIQMPLMALNEFSPYMSNVSDLPEITFRKSAAHPGKKLMGKRVMVQGSFDNDARDGAFHYTSIVVAQDRD